MYNSFFKIHKRLKAKNYCFSPDFREMFVNVELIFSGHGNMIENPIELLKERIKDIDVKANKYIKMIKSGISTASEIAQLRYKEKYEKQFLQYYV